MKYPISKSPTVIQQSIGPSCLLVNEGPGTVYLDSNSSVTVDSYSLRCSAGQSVNWQGGSLWAISDDNAFLTLMVGGDTSITPIHDVTVQGDVSLAGPVEISGTVPITGNVGIDGDVTLSGPVEISGTVPITGDVGINGPINIDNINGNVNVDGSEVNIGNNVRLWAGGDHLGTVEWDGWLGSEQTEYLDVKFPKLRDAKYASVRLVVQIEYANRPFTKANVMMGNNFYSIYGYYPPDIMGEIFYLEFPIGGGAAPNNILIDPGTHLITMEMPLTQTRPSWAINYAPSDSNPHFTASLFGQYNAVEAKILPGGKWLDNWWSGATTLNMRTFRAVKSPPLTSESRFLIPPSSKTTNVSLSTGNGAITAGLARDRFVNLSPIAAPVVLLLQNNIGTFQNRVAGFEVPPAPFVQAIRISEAAATTATIYYLTLD